MYLPERTISTIGEENPPDVFTSSTTYLSK